MQYRKLGNSDIEVSALAMGCWGIGGDQVWGPTDEQQITETIHAALDSGINFFDTAEGYGGSETIMGKALRGHRDKAVIATKVSGNNLKHDDVIAACEGSLSRLQTDYIDLYQIHWPREHIPVEETWQAMAELKEQGKVRELGISNFGITQMQGLPDQPACVSNQHAYSLLWRAIEFEILPMCMATKMGLLCYSPLVHGLLTGRYTTPGDFPDERARTRHFSRNRKLVRHGGAGAEDQTFEAIGEIIRISAALAQPVSAVALAWLLHMPGVTAVLAGARSPEQAGANARAGDLVLDESVLKQLDRATDALKQAMGTNADMWQSEPRIK